MGERHTCTVDVAGSSPVSSTMKCELCELKIKTTVYLENEHFIILDCKDCKVPMIVWKEHTMNIPESDESIMYAMLYDTACMFYESWDGKDFYIEKTQRKIPDHLHWHAHKKIKESA